MAMQQQQQQQQQQAAAQGHPGMMQNMQGGHWVMVPQSYVHSASVQCASLFSAALPPCCIPWERPHTRSP